MTRLTAWSISLNYDLPRIKTLVSDKKTRIADLTREAETALANGKYLTAENRYRQIMLDTNDDPLPQAGLIHAQLGAGMFRSAGTNLRALFQQHPELIAARYDAKLLPTQERTGVDPAGTSIRHQPRRRWQERTTALSLPGLPGRLTAGRPVRPGTGSIQVATRPAAAGCP